jgi:hypothetical protein
LNPQYDYVHHYNVKPRIHLSGDGAMMLTKVKAADSRQSVTVNSVYGRSYSENVPLEAW